MSLIGDVEGLLRELRFAQKVRNALTGVRLVHESDEQTFERILALGASLVCSRCRGYGKTASGCECPECHGARVREPGEFKAT